MLASLFLTLSCIFASVFAQGQIVFDAIHNATDITGTWGHGGVNTGPGFAHPLNYSFTYPATTGISISFTDDNFFELAMYRFTSNGTDPHCIIGVVFWQHGTYQLLSNGSIVLTPIPEDGRQQVQDPCAAISNQIIQWSTSVLYAQWRIFQLPGGGFHLHLWNFDGSPNPPMELRFKPPSMLPTAQLTPKNSTAAPPPPTTGPGKRKRSGAGSSRTVSGLAGLAGLSAVLLIALCVDFL